METNQIQKIDGRKSPMLSFLQKQGVDLSAKDHRKYKFVATGFMDLTVETWREFDNILSISVSHYGKQNGDLMRDPEILIFKYENSDKEIPVYYRNDYIGLEQIGYDFKNGQLLIKPRLVKDLKAFLKTWASNLTFQGHKMGGD